MKPSEWLESRFKQLAIGVSPGRAKWQAIQEWLDQDKADQSGKSCPPEDGALPVVNLRGTPEQHYAWALDLLAERLRAHLPDTELRTAMRYVCQTREQLSGHAFAEVGETMLMRPIDALQTANSQLRIERDGARSVIDRALHELGKYAAMRKAEHDAQVPEKTER